MLNPALEKLPPYPFQRLRDLIDRFEPPKGLEPLALSIGEPQHPVPALVDKVLAEGGESWGKYPPVPGTPTLNEAIAQWLRGRYGLPESLLTAEANVLPVVGTREALFLIANLVTPAEKNGQRPAILMPNPFYQVYAGGAVMHGADPVYLPATRETGFQPDLDGLDEALLKRTAALYLCSPGNPQGSVASAALLEKAIRLARQYDFLLIADECYAEIYDRTPPVGALEVCKTLGDGLKNVLAFHSLSKRSNVPGLRSGFVAGDPKVVAAFAQLRSYGGATLPMPLMAVSEALWRDETHVEENRALYRKKFNIADRLLGGKLGYYRPDGGFFLWLEVGDGEEAAVKLWREGAVRVIPGGYLAGDQPDGTNPGKAFIRVALVHDIDTTREALTRIANILGS